VAEGEASVVNLRVQVIDLRSFTLDLQVPTYLPARDLTQRVARDAGLDAYWPDGRRRLYWMRARGRLMREDEKLQDLGVIDGELIYLLPEPPAGSGVLEQPPEYPETHPYAGAGWVTLFAAFFLVVAWSIGWGLALMRSLEWHTVTLPGLGLGFLSTSLSRHAWGGAASRVRIALTGLAFQCMITLLAFLVPVVVNRQPFVEVYAHSVPGLVLGVLAVLAGWLAWWGAVEALPPAHQLQEEIKQAAVALVKCGICGAPVDPTVRADCAYGCGQVFHQGCYRAKTTAYRGDRNKCAVCGQKVA
jgi:uncharacterized ubiquitin-like protein YukD